MVYIRYIILEWGGTWRIPDPTHGGISPGPYKQSDHASKAIEAYAQKAYDGWTNLAGPEVAERERMIVLRNHCIVETAVPEGPDGPNSGNTT